MANSEKSARADPLPESGTRRESSPAHRIPWSQQRKIWAYVFISLPFLYFLIVNFGAMLVSFSFSFQKYGTLTSVHPFVGLANYQGIFADPKYLQALKNTFMFALIRVPVIMVSSLGVALLLTSIKHFKGFFRVLYFIPFVTSGVAISWVFKFMYLPNFGIFTALFDFLNIPRIAFLDDPDWALLSIVVVTIWASIGFYALIFLAGLEDIPVEFYEAAMVDGASAWQNFRHITIPLLNRTIVLATVLCLISSLQTFTFVRMMSADNGFGGPLGATITLPIMIYREAFFSMNMGRAAAISVVFFLIILFLSLIQRRVLSREVEY
jgi:multiple sugar transport system permease protein